MKREPNNDEETLKVEEILTFHQEKRTALKSVRMGIAMVVVQASLFALMEVPLVLQSSMASHRLFLLLAVNLLFFLLSLGCIVFALIRIHRLDRKISTFEQGRRF